MRIERSKIVVLYPDTCNNNPAECGYTECPYLRICSVNFMLAMIIDMVYIGAVITGGY